MSQQARVWFRVIGLALILSALVMVALATPVNAAPSATIVCGTAEPSRRADGSFDLLVGSTNYPRYTGKPFSFKLTVWHVGMDGGYRKTFTYVGTPRSFHTPKFNKAEWGGWYSVESWQSGTKCKTVKN